MTSSTPLAHRARRVGLALAAAGLLLTGCSAASGAAVTIGNVSFSQDTLLQSSQNLQDTLPPELDTIEIRQEINRLQLTRTVRHELTADLAAQWQLSVDEAAVNAQLAQKPVEQWSAELGVPVSEVPRMLRDQLLLLQITQVAVSNGLVVDVVRVQVDGAEVSTHAEAVALRAALFRSDAESTLAAIAAASAGQQGPEAGSPVRVQTQEYSQANPNTAGAGSTGLFVAQPGQVVIVPQEESFVVLRVLQRDVNRVQIDLSAFAQGGLNAITPLLLASAAATADVTVNPRFGVWDPVAVAVVPNPATF